jgi:hypothetical protein
MLGESRTLPSLPRRRDTRGKERNGAIIENLTPEEIGRGKEEIHTLPAEDLLDHHSQASGDILIHPLSVVPLTDHQTEKEEGEEENPHASSSPAENVGMGMSVGSLMFFPLHLKVRLLSL